VSGPQAITLSSIGALGEGSGLRLGHIGCAREFTKERREVLS
jgi:hypothetical protein